MNNQGQSVGCSQEELLPIAGNVIKRNVNKPHLGKPTSYGTGTHISLNQKGIISIPCGLDITFQLVKDVLINFFLILKKNNILVTVKTN